MKAAWSYSRFILPEKEVEDLFASCPGEFQSDDGICFDMFWLFFEPVGHLKSSLNHHVHVETDPSGEKFA